MTPEADGPARIGELLESFLRERGMKQQVERQSVLEEWPERVGPKIARVTRPRSVAESTLFVEVRSSAWLMELNMMKGRILERLNRGHEDAPLEKIVFVLAEDGAQGPSPM